VSEETKTVSGSVSVAKFADGFRDYASCPISIAIQMASLAKLDDGWYDEASRKYEPEELRWVTRLLSSVLDAFTLPTPYIYPTPEGLVRAEWSRGNAEVIVNIDLSIQSAEVIAALAGSDDVDELTVAFADHNAERVLGLFLSRYLR
jgi:hypothetical protein